MNKISIKNIRTFSAPEDVDIKPITVLVGENSTGKSTLLAVVRLCWDAATEAKILDFNEEPFSLGSFDQISHFRGGKAGRAKHFSFGLSTFVRLRNERPAKLNVTETFEFSRKGSHPFLSTQALECEVFSMRADTSVETDEITLKLVIGQKTSSVSFSKEMLPNFPFAGNPIDFEYLMFRAGWSRFRRNAPEQPSLLDSFNQGELEAVENILRPFRHALGSRPIAVAPIRSRPQRTYHPTSELHLADGGHIPLLLAKAYFQKDSKSDDLIRSLNEFGRDSGLFTSIGVKSLGRHESDPFQLAIKIEGPASNIVDVGYGVSQVLPLLVDPLLAEKGSTFLLQQPEVHLHPKGQAQLANFLCMIAKQRGIKFVIETHSDYFLSRLQIAVRRGQIANEDVSVAYFEDWA